MVQLRIMATGEADVTAIRSETFRGRNYTVVPVVALVEGVLQGLNAEEPEFAPAEEFGKFPMTWNNRPITMNHPRRDGVLCSAGDPDIREEYEFGFMANTTLEDGKLKTEAWLDDEIIDTKKGEFLETKQRLLDGEMVEVSTGLFSDLMSKKGSFNGTKYKVAWANVVPDHLAFLSAGTIGACSIEDGCGAPRLNADGSTVVTTDSKPTVSTAAPTRLGSSSEAQASAQTPCCDACAKGGTHMTTNTNTNTTPSPTLNSAEDNATGKETPAPTPTPTPTPEGGDNGIPNEEPAGEATTDGGSGTEDQPGSSEEGGTQGAGEEGSEGSSDVSNLNPEDVVADVEEQAQLVSAFERLTANAVAPEITFENARQIVQNALRKNFPEGHVSDCGCHYYRYTYILAMNQDWVAFETWNRGYEASVTVAMQYSIDESGGVTFTGEPVPVNLITKIVPIPAGSADDGINANAAGGSSGADQQQKEGHMADETNATTTGAGGEPNVNGAGNPPAPRTLEAFLADAPAEVAAVVNEGIALRTQKKSNLVKGILANSQVFSEEELNGKDIPELEKLHAMSTPPAASFEGRAVPLFGTAGTEGISTNSQRDNQRSVPEAPRAFSAKPVRKADYSNDAGDTAAA